MYGFFFLVLGWFVVNGENLLLNYFEGCFVDIFVCLFCFIVGK